MVQKIFQLENDEVLVTDGQSTYSDTKENFIKDYPAFGSFSNDLIIYNQTLKVHVIDNKMQTYTAQSKLDTCIDAVKAIIDAQNSRTGNKDVDDSVEPTVDTQPNNTGDKDATT